MKIAVVGSRHFQNLQFVERLGENLPGWGDILVISGGAYGVDKTIENKCKEWQIRFKCFPATWYDDNGKYDKLAGIKRNTLIAELCDLCICFWDGESKGAIDTVKKTKKLNKDYIIFGPDGQILKNKISAETIDFVAKVVLQK